jgi:NTE family protein
MKNAQVGLVVTGGGARGAYQAGVLKRIGEMQRVKKTGNPFPIIAGCSAGAVNGSALAAGCDDFAGVTRALARQWSSLAPSDIFRVDLFSQARNSLTWIMDLSFGGFLGGGNARSLLDATPLMHYLRAHLDCDRIQNNINRGHLDALSICATNYNSGKSYLFIHGKKGHAMWQRSRRVTLATRITVEHVCASAAIPVVFQPIKLNTPMGTAFFGDGCVRLQQPLSPVIRLGADRVLAVGIRCEELEHQLDTTAEEEPSLAEIMGVLFNVAFLDNLTSDIEHLERLNELLRCSQMSRSGLEGCEKMRPVKCLLITPSVSLTKVADDHRKAMPPLIQYFINSLGRNAASCSDLMSYLLFVSEYTRALVEVGYGDADARIDEIENLFYASDGKNN